MSGEDIAAEIAEALEEVGQEVGDGAGAYTCTIRRAPTEADEPENPWDSPASPANDPTDYGVSAVESVKEVRDEKGKLTGVQRRVLTISATTVEPLKSDVIAVGVGKNNVTADTVFEEILEVNTLSPAGVALLYEIELAL